MPSPVKRTPQGAFYRRKDGAWIKVKGKFVKVGCNKYKNRVHYSKRNTYVDWRYRKAKKNAKLRRRYPQEYD